MMFHLLYFLLLLFHYLVFIVLIISPLLISSHSPEEWKSRSIYQILTDRFALPNSSSQPCANIRDYCGGTYVGVINHLDYIQDLGFNAIWISPIVKNVPHSFHGYAALNLYELNPNFGTESEFIAMIKECHQRDIWIMLDVVANHMAAVGNDFSSLVPFNESVYFHDCKGCDSNCNIRQDAWNPPNVTQIEHCRLDGLVDLDQDNSYVRSTLLDWINNIINKYNIDGLRIDTVPEVKPAFWREWQNSAGVYAFGEVFNSDIQYVAAFQQVLNATLSYPLFFTLRNIFAQQQSMKQLQSSFNDYDKYFADPSILGTFIDNHDNARFLSLNSDSSLYLNGITYVLTSRGIPIIYYGSEQGFNGPTDPYNREPLWVTKYTNNTIYYPYIKTLNNYRNQSRLGYEDQKLVYVSDNMFAYVRGNNTFIVLTQIGSKGKNESITINNIPLTDGQLISIWNNKDIVNISNGTATITFTNGLPLVYSHQNSQNKYTHSM